MKPTRTGRMLAIMAALLLIAGFLIDYPELVALGLACVLALLVAGAWMLVRPNLTVERDINPPRVSAGDRASAVVRLTNTGRRRSPPVMAVDTVAGRQLRVPLPSVAKDGELSTSYRL